MSAKTGNAQTRKRASSTAAQVDIDQRDVRSKLSDITRIMEDIVSENEDARQERMTLKQSLTEAHVQCNAAKEAATAAKEKCEEELRLARERHDAELRTQALDFEHTIQELMEERNELQRQLDTSTRDSAELGGMRLTVASVKAQLRDYITLESAGVSLLTTTGQVIQWRTCARTARLTHPPPLDR
jgi:chromosome segregation ATPase